MFKLIKSALGTHPKNILFKLQVYSGVCKCNAKLLHLTSTNCIIPCHAGKTAICLGNGNNLMNTTILHRLNSTGTDYIENSIADNELEPSTEESSELDELIAEDKIQTASIDDSSSMQLLLKCQTQDEIFNWIQSNSNDLKKHFAVKCVLCIWDLLKSNDHSGIAEVGSANLHNPAFQLLLYRIREYCKQMSPDELTVCFLYLSKFGLTMEDKTMQMLLNNCLEIMEDEAAEFSLTALSRFTVTVNASKQLYTFFVCQNAFARILQYLETVQTPEELRLVTICLNSLHQLITPEILDDYKRKVTELYENGSLTADKTNVLLKIIQFLNYSHWSQKNTELLRNLALMLSTNIDKFQMRELEQLFKVLQSQLEPALLTSLITKQAETLFEKTPTAELLACSVMYALPEKRNEMTAFAKDFIYSKDVTAVSTLPTLFKILRYLKISNVYICDGYWSKVLNDIQSKKSEQESYILARHCHRYMHFNNNLGGTYRHKTFEKHIVSLMNADLVSGITSIIPSQFAKVAAFMLAYGHTPNSRNIFPDFIIHRIEDMRNQFKIVDCLHISRGIQIALQMRFKNRISSELATQLNRIEIAMNECTERHLSEKNLSIAQLNTILRSYTNRQTSIKTSLFHKIINKYEEIQYNLNSRIIREITFNLNTSKFTMPVVCEQMLDYVLINKEHVLGDTVEKLLYCCYNLGYMPKNEDVLKCSIDIINRDFNYMNALSIVQACLALTFYKVLPQALINRVFNIDFIKRIEDEIEMCYSKATYPERVLNQVMQLNRAVCLDCPASGVPWFQQNYIEAQLSKLPAIKNKFHLDIKTMLLSFLTDQNHLKIDHVTPYGYRIDFVLHFDQNNKPVSVPKSSNGLIDNINKVAILLLKIDAFCQNNRNQLRGQEILRERHLEMLGYKVVQVNYSEWNAMYMSVPGAKVTYLKNLLQLT